MADQRVPTDGRVQAELPPTLFGMVAILVTVVVIATLYFAREIFIPITLAILLSFLLAPAVRRLRRWRVGRVSAVSFTVVVASLAILGFGAVIVQEITSLAQELPSYHYNLHTKIRSLPGLLPGGGVLHRATDMLRELHNELTKTETQNPALADGGANAATSAETTKPIPVQIREPDPRPLQIVENIIGPLLQPLATSGLVLVFVILMLLEREDLRDRFLRLAGRGDLHRTTEAMDDAAKRISRYLRSQLIVNTCVGLPIGIGLTVIGIPNAALWGIMTVILRFIPYLGIVIAAAFPLALAIAVAPGWDLLIWTVLLFVAIELVVSNVVEPWVYGDSTGVSPVALIAAATFWTWLWGPIGLLLSTPVTVCLVVLGRYVPKLQFLDVMLGNEPVLSPEETFYQRMLAGDPEEATQQAEEFAKEHSLAEFFDQVAIPALAMAQADSDRGALPAERRRALTEGFRSMLENLADDAAEDAGSSAEPSERPEAEDPPRIVLVAGRNELDETAALCLEHLLRRQCRTGEVQALSADALASDNLYLLPLRNASFVCLSLISTGSPARARYLVRRVRRRASRAKVMVGFWGLSQEQLSEAEKAATSADTVATSLRDAVEDIESSCAADRDPAGTAPKSMAGSPGLRKGTLS
jgi:predicted PurR-regulated permease PerM